MYQTADGPGRRILVVEDEDMVRDLIVTHLAIAGYQTFEATDGFDGLLRIEQVRPDAMLLDVNMPRLDGFGMLKLMKSRGVKTPTMVLTARNQPEDVRAAIGLGARDFLTKPFRNDQLLTRVARLLRKAPSVSA